MAIAMGVAILLLHLYYYAIPLWERLGWTHQAVINIFLKLRQGGLFDNPYYTKFYALLLSTVTTFIRKGRMVETPWWKIGTALGIGLLFYLIPFSNPITYTFFTLTSYIVVVYSASMAIQKLTRFIKKKNDINETFEQCEEKINTQYSINLPTRYQYKGKMRSGWINIVNPFRGTLVLGTPGSGKSYSVFRYDNGILMVLEHHRTSCLPLLFWNVLKHFRCTIYLQLSPTCKAIAAIFLRRELASPHPKLFPRTAYVGATYLDGVGIGVGIVQQFHL